MQRSVPQRRSVATPALALRRVADPSGQADDEDVGSADAWSRMMKPDRRTQPKRTAEAFLKPEVHSHTGQVA